MKKRIALLSLVSLFSLSSCKFIDDFLGLFKKLPWNNQQEDKKQEDEEQHKEEHLEKIGEFYGGVKDDGSYIGYEFSKSEQKIEKPTSGVGSLNIYAFNDFHGSVVSADDEVGLKTLGTFLKEKSTKANTLILDQGDTWQGSFESNYQYGAIVQDVFNYAGVSLRTVGNHDFDWGLNHLEETNNRKRGSDYIPVLASNVFDYSNGRNGTTQQNKYGKEYATFVLDNGIKVGIVGVIGKSQITSISSQLVSSICFTDHVNKAKEISDYLRNGKACDVIIVSSHEATSSMVNSGLDQISPVSNKRYADLVLSGHAHYLQNQTRNGVKYVQWDSNGRSTGLITLKYDFANNSIIDSSTEVDTYYANYLRTYYPNAEPIIEQMVDSYLEVTQPRRSQVLSSNFTGYFDTSSLGYLMSESIYNFAKNTGKTIDFAVCNYARSEFYGDVFTYGDLYKAFPFDNQVILMDVSSSYSINSISWNELYREDTSLVPVAGNTYRIAVIDYLGLHQDENRQYDKFPDARNMEILTLDGLNEPPKYRDMLYEYLLGNPEKQFNGNDYTRDNPHFNTN